MLTTIWRPGDYDQAARELELHADEAMALTKPAQQPAPVISIDTRERLQ